tara:strand:- start:1030 stop:1188 length:159 start_codon:yes stop_codon:yes gene_type:complete
MSLDDHENVGKDRKGSLEERPTPFQDVGICQREIPRFFASVYMESTKECTLE